MVQLLLSQNAITVYEILIIVILVIVFIRQNRKNRDFEERRNISNEKMRNVALEEKLKNPESRMLQLITAVYLWKRKNIK